MVNEPYSPPRKTPWALIVGVGLAVIGGGAVAYVLTQAKTGAVTPTQAGVRYSPKMPLAPVNQTIAATISFTNPSKSAVTFGVQGLVIEGSPYNVVGGHFWTSVSIARQAVTSYFAGNLQQAAQMATVAANRVYATTVQPGQTGIATLYDILTPAAGQRFVFLIMASPPAGKLIFADPTGTAVAQLQRASGTTQIVSSVTVY